jgi:RNA polymerase sigma-70 factor (ECF subfamily)
MPVRVVIVLVKRDNDAVDNSATMNDRELILGSLEGCEEDFAVLLSRHHGLIWSAAWRVAMNREDAVDICQEVAIRVWRGLSTIDVDRPFAPWLRTVAVREALRWLQRNGRDRDDVPLEEIDTESLNELQTPALARTVAATAELRARLVDRIKDLAPRQRVALGLRYLDDLQVREIASAMGCTEGSVKQHLCRAVRRLRRLLGNKE